MIAGKLSFISLWGVWETVDEMGRHGRVVGYFRTEERAKQAAEKQGWFGGTGDIVKVKALNLGEIDDSCIEKVVIVTDGPLEPDVNLIVRHKDRVAAAKQKLEAALTREEIDLLGITA